MTRKMFAVFVLAMRSPKLVNEGHGNGVLANQLLLIRTKAKFIIVFPHI